MFTSSSTTRTRSGEPSARVRSAAGAELMTSACARCLCVSCEEPAGSSTSDPRHRSGTGRRAMVSTMSDTEPTAERPRPSRTRPGARRLRPRTAAPGPRLRAQVGRGGGPGRRGPGWPRAASASTRRPTATAGTAGWAGSGRAAGSRTAQEDEAARVASPKVPASRAPGGQAPQAAPSPRRRPARIPDFRALRPTDLWFHPVRGVEQTFGHRKTERALGRHTGRRLHGVRRRTPRAPVPHRLPAVR